MFANKAAAERAKADLFEALKKAVKKYIEQNVNRPEPVHWSEDLGLQATTLSILRHEVNVSVFFKSGDERAHKVWDFLCSLPLSEVHSIAESIAPGLNHESKCKIFIKQLLAQLGLLNIVFHSPTIPQFYNATAFLRDSDLPDMALAVLQGVSHLPAALPVEAPPPFERSESVLSPTLDSLSSPTTTSPAPAAAAAAAPAAAPAPAAIPTPPAAPAPALVPTPAPASVAMSAGTARSLSLAGPDSPAPFNDEVIVVRRKVHRQGTKDKPRKPKATRTESASTVDEAAAAAAGPPGPAASDAADTASVLGGEGPAESAEPVITAVDLAAAASEQAVTTDNAALLPHPPTADAHEPDQVSQPAESPVSVSTIHPGSSAVDGASHPHDPAPAPIQQTEAVTILDERAVEHPTPSATEHAAPPAAAAVPHVASVSHDAGEPKHVGQAIPAPAPEPVVAAVHENGLSSNRHVAVTPHVDVAVVAAAPSAPVAAVHTAGAQTNPEASHDSESAAAAAPSSTHAAAATAAAGVVRVLVGGHGLTAAAVCLALTLPRHAAHILIAAVARLGPLLLPLTLAVTHLTHFRLVIFAIGVCITAHNILLLILFFAPSCCCPASRRSQSDAFCSLPSRSVG
eukprot:m.102700 g.102700  ORF g.102700 m.102700 type:complete len:628 (-) comp14125_c0_seq1:1375-3258(-)